MIKLGIYAVIYCVLVPLIGGTPMMLFMTKVNKFGIVFGFLADLIAKSGSYKSSKKAILSCGVFNILIFGNFVPLLINMEEGRIVLDLPMPLSP